MGEKSRIFLALIMLLAHPLCSAQSLKVTFTDLGTTKTYKILTLKNYDSLLIEKVLSDFLIPLYSKGFLSASIDTIVCDSATITAYGKMGLKYHWVKLIPDSASNMVLNDLGINLPKFSGKPVSPKFLARYINLSLHYLEDNGYPFAKVGLNNIDISNSSVNATIGIDKGSRVIIDTIYLKGDARIATQKLSALINLKRGELYSESKIRRIDSRLNQQQYLSIIKPSEIEFLNQKARVYCYLSNRPASRFWGLAGFYSDREDGKIKLNGDINLSLVNSLRYGEKINFVWSAPGEGTQNLNINTDWPYILGWQVGVVGAFSLYRHDSTYISLNPKLSFSFFTTSGGRFLLNLDYKKTSYTSNSLVSQAQYGNSSAFLYGLGYEYSLYDNAILPTRGISLRTNVNTGSRRLQKQKPISNLIEGDIFAETFIPLYEKRFVLGIRSNSKVRAIYNTKGSTTLFENEMYRIGGMGTIRGFNQEAVLSTAYSIASLELHLRTSEGSGIYLFTEKAFVRAYELGFSRDRWPMGLGIGLNMVIKAGLFNLSYALGQGFGQSLSTRDAKVHFGIATTF
ncbi:MAG: hypothetical protein EHM93_11670 [Bacteroidales bacterium]|nr:MAG: hypothetical protein EHM93_11670 [Bacteroidales bacterium]